jgi:ankyrin repeat protein
MALFFEAVKNNDVGLVRELIRNGENVNGKDRFGSTSLHVASAYGHTETVQELISCGASLNEKDRFGYTPLHYASKNGHTEIVKVLLRNGASPNEKNDNEQKTPLHLVSWNRNIEIIKELLFFGADYTIQNWKGEDGLYGLSEEQRTLVLEECCSVEVKEPSVE